MEQFVPPKTPDPGFIIESGARVLLKGGAVRSPGNSFIVWISWGCQRLPLSSVTGTRFGPG